MFSEGLTVSVVVKVASTVGLMCYPKPGPRCAAHTRIALQSAKTAFDDAKDAENSAKQAMLAVVDRLDAENPGQHFFNTHPDMEEPVRLYQAAGNARKEASTALVRAQAQYDSTNPGMKELQSELDGCQDPDERYDLVRRRQRATQYRESDRRAWQKYLERGPAPKAQSFFITDQEAVRKLYDAVSRSQDDSEKHQRYWVTSSRRLAADQFGGDVEAGDRLVEQVKRWQKHVKRYGPKAAAAPAKR